MTRTVELAVVALVRSANKGQTALPLLGLPQHQGALYRVHILGAEAGAELCWALEGAEDVQGLEALVDTLRAPLEEGSALGKYLVRSAVLEEGREMSLTPSPSGYLARAAAQVANRGPVGALALNDYMEGNYPGECFGSRCLKKLNRALESCGVGLLPVAPAA